MLPLLLVLLGSMLVAQPDWSLYTPADKLRVRVEEVTQRNNEMMKLSIIRNQDAAAQSSSSSDNSIQVVHIRNVLADPTSPVNEHHQLSSAPTSSSTPSSSSSDAATLLTQLVTDMIAREGNGREQQQDEPSLTASFNSARPISILYNFGEHGREIISSEIALNILQHLDTLDAAIAIDSAMLNAAAATDPTAAANARRELDAARAKAVISPRYLSFLFSHASLTLIPLLNVWSHRRVERGQLCERKNEHGIDLNRNWPFTWTPEEHKAAAAKPQSLAERERRMRATVRTVDEQYGGRAAFSEFESRALRDVAMQSKPDLYMNWHAGIREMYCGWDHKAELIPNKEEIMRLLQHVNHRYCRCRIGGAGAIGGYPVYGGSMDYMYTKINTTYSITIEVHGGEPGVHPSDCFRYFNPDTKERLEQVKHEWTQAAIDAIDFVVREKKFITFPFQLPDFLTNTKPDDSKRAPPSTSKALPLNHYRRFAEMLLSITATGSFTRITLSPPATIVDEPSAGVPHASLTGTPAHAPRRIWRDECTPFIPALPQSLATILEQRREVHACTWAEGANKVDERSGMSGAASVDGNGKHSSRRVWIIGGDMWNDLLTPHTITDWMMAAAAEKNVTGGISPATHSSRFFYTPSLLSSARLLDVDSAIHHASLCSHLLSADARVRLLTHQLYAQRAFTRLMQQQIQPDVIVQLMADRYHGEIAGSTNQKSYMEQSGDSSSAGSGTASSFMHIEIINLTADPSLTLPSRVIHHLQRAIASSSTPAAASLPVISWSARAYAAGDARADGDNDGQQNGGEKTSHRRCYIGQVDVERALLRRHDSKREGKLCSTCKLLIKIYAHGVQSRPTDNSTTSHPSSPPSSSPSVATSHPSNFIDAAALAASSSHSAWNVRSQSDRQSPHSYIPSATHVSKLSQSPMPNTPLFIDMAQTQFERSQRRHVRQGSKLPSAWCDSLSRNIDAHHPSQLLAWHTHDSQRVWRVLRQAIMDVAGGIGPTMHGDDEEDRVAWQQADHVLMQARMAEARRFMDESQGILESEDIDVLLSVHAMPRDPAVSISAAPHLHPPSFFPALANPSGESEWSFGLFPLLVSWLPLLCLILVIVISMDVKRRRNRDRKWKWWWGRGRERDEQGAWRREARMEVLI